MSSLNHREADIIVAVQDAAYEVPGLKPFARGLSTFGEHALGWMGSAAVGAGVDSKRRRQWVALGVSAFGAHAASVIIKRVVRRRRPLDPRIKVGVSTPSTLSFPSSHSSSTTASLVSLAQMTGKPWPLVGVPVMMVSRILLGVHYPTDTVVGATIGAVTATTVTQIERRTR